MIYKKALDVQLLNFQKRESEANFKLSAIINRWKN